MTDQNYNHIAVVLDRSGSMEQIKTDTMGGFNTFMADQRQQPGKCLVTLAQFDSSYDIVYRNREVAKVPPLVLEPRGNTALLDAIGRTITELGTYFESLAEKDRPGSVTVLIFTDGEENSSREYSSAKIKEMITHQETVYSWVFTFLGSNQDAVLVGQGLGISAGHSLTYIGAAAPVAFAAASTMNTSMRTDTMRGVGPSAGTTYNYSDKDRTLSMADEEDVVSTP